MKRIITFVCIFFLASFLITAQNSNVFNCSDVQFLAGSVFYRNFAPESFIGRMIDSGVSVENTDNMISFCFLITKHEKEEYADFFLYRMYKAQEIRDGEFIALMMSYLKNAKLFTGKDENSLSDFDITNVLWCLEKFREIQNAQGSPSAAQHK